MSTRVRHIVGCMTGTSIDGLDAALTRVEGTGLAMHARVLGHFSGDFASLGINASALRALAQQQPTTTQAIARATQSSHELLLAGGGVHNRALVNTITAWASSRVRTLDEVGVPASAREAAEMGVLGALCQDRVPITLPGVTGVPAAPIAGCWAGSTTTHQR